MAEPDPGQVGAEEQRVPPVTHRPPAVVGVTLKRSQQECAAGSTSVTESVSLNSGLLKTTQEGTVLVSHGGDLTSDGVVKSDFTAGSAGDHKEMIEVVKSSDRHRECVIPPSAVDAEKMCANLVKEGADSSDKTSQLATEVGQKHLEHIDRLMKHLGDLREQNEQLQMRIHYLEDLNKLPEKVTLRCRRPEVRGQAKRGSADSFLRRNDVSSSDPQPCKIASDGDQRCRSRSVGGATPRCVSPLFSRSPQKPLKSTVSNTEEIPRQEDVQEERDEFNNDARIRKPSAVLQLPEADSTDPQLNETHSRCLQIQEPRHLPPAHVKSSPEDSVFSDKPDGGMNARTSSVSSSNCSSNEELHSQVFIGFERHANGRKRSRTSSDVTAKESACRNEQDTSTWSRVRAFVQPRRFSVARTKKKSSSASSDADTVGGGSDRSSCRSALEDCEEDIMFLLDRRRRDSQDTAIWRSTEELGRQKQQDRSTTPDGPRSEGATEILTGADITEGSGDRRSADMDRTEPRLYGMTSNTKKLTLDIDALLNQAYLMQTKPRRKSNWSKIRTLSPSSATMNKPTPSSSASLPPYFDRYESERLQLESPASSLDPASPYSPASSTNSSFLFSPDSPVMLGGDRVFPSPSLPSTVHSPSSTPLSADFARKLQEWDRLKRGQQSHRHTPSFTWSHHDAPAEEKSGRSELQLFQDEADLQKQLALVCQEAQLPAGFRRRLYEWELLKQQQRTRASTAPSTTSRRRGHSHSSDASPPSVSKKSGSLQLTLGSTLSGCYSDQGQSPDAAGRSKGRFQARWSDCEMKGQLDIRSRPRAGHVGSPQSIEEGSLPADFRKRLIEWEISKALAGKSEQNIEALQKSLSADFNLKYEQWQLMKSEGCRTVEGLVTMKKHRTARPEKPPSVDFVSHSLGRYAGANRQVKTKEMQWLEKELQKVEREKARLEREKEKYMDREARLEKMRDAMFRPRKDRVTVRTAKGEFEFEGINKNFTKKLYEWEQRRGIAPDSESSTIALLDPNYTPEPDTSRLTRCKSEGSLVDWPCSGPHSLQSSDDLTASISQEDSAADTSTRSISVPELHVVPSRRLTLPYPTDQSQLTSSQQPDTFTPVTVSVSHTSQHLPMTVSVSHTSQETPVTVPVGSMSDDSSVTVSVVHTSPDPAVTPSVSHASRDSSVVETVPVTSQDTSVTVPVIVTSPDGQSADCSCDTTEVTQLTDGRSTRGQDDRSTVGEMSSCSEGGLAELVSLSDEIFSQLKSTEDVCCDVERNLKIIHKGMDEPEQTSYDASERGETTTDASDLASSESVEPTLEEDIRRIDRRFQQLQTSLNVNADILLKTEPASNVLGPLNTHLPDRPAGTSLTSLKHGAQISNQRADIAQSQFAAVSETDIRTLPEQHSLLATSTYNNYLNATPLKRKIAAASPKHQPIPEETLSASEAEAILEDSLAETSSSSAVSGALTCSLLTPSGTPSNIRSIGSSSYSSTEDIFPKWKSKTEMYSSYDQTLKDMQKELEDVECSYDLKHRRKSSDDIVSTPSSYRSRSSSIPSSEEVDEGNVRQVLEHGDSDNLVEEDDEKSDASQSESSERSRRRRRRSSCEVLQRAFTAGATRSFSIPTIMTQSLSSRHGADPSCSAVLVPVHRTVYVVENGVLQVRSRLSDLAAAADEEQDDQTVELHHEGSRSELAAAVVDISGQVAAVDEVAGSEGFIGVTANMFRTTRSMNDAGHCEIQQEREEGVFFDNRNTHTFIEDQQEAGTKIRKRKATLSSEENPPAYLHVPDTPNHVASAPWIVKECGRDLNTEAISSSSSAASTHCTENSLGSVSRRLLVGHSHKEDTNELASCTSKSSCVQKNNGKSEQEIKVIIEDTENTIKDSNLELDVIHSVRELDVTDSVCELDVTDSVRELDVTDSASELDATDSIRELDVVDSVGELDVADSVRELDTSDIEKTYRNTTELDTLKSGEINMTEIIVSIMEVASASTADVSGSIGDEVKLGVDAEAGLKPSGEIMSRSAAARHSRSSEAVVDVEPHTTRYRLKPLMSRQVPRLSTTAELRTRLDLGSPPSGAHTVHNHPPLRSVDSSTYGRVGTAGSSFDEVSSGFMMYAEAQMKEEMIHLRSQRIRQARDEFFGALNSFTAQQSQTDSSRSSQDHSVTGSSRMCPSDAASGGPEQNSITGSSRMCLSGAASGGPEGDLGVDEVEPVGDNSASVRPKRSVRGKVWPFKRSKKLCNTKSEDTTDGNS